MTLNTTDARALYAVWCDDVEWLTLKWDELPAQEQHAWIRVAAAAGERERWDKLREYVEQQHDREDVTHKRMRDQGAPEHWWMPLGGMLTAYRNVLGKIRELTETTGENAEPAYTFTRSQLVDAIAGISVQGVRLPGRDDPVVLADDMADEILSHRRLLGPTIGGAQ